MHLFLVLRTTELYQLHMPELHIVLLACSKAIHCDIHLRNKCTILTQFLT